MIKPHKDFSKAQSHLNKNRLYVETYMYDIESWPNNHLMY